MNAERLHAIVLALKSEISAGNVVGKLKQLINTLQEVVTTPQEPQQQRFANSLKEFYSATTNTLSDSFSPAWRQVLSEIGGENLFGSNLKKAVEDILARNQITPAVALNELKELQNHLGVFSKEIDNTSSALLQFKIGNEALAPGESEIGILIPRKAVNNHLNEFSNELDELSFILNVFSEVATGKTSDLTIRTISSSDFMVYLNAALPFAACLAVAIERTVTLYKQLLEIRKIRQDLKNQGVPAKQTAGIEDYANNLMQTGLEKVAIEIVEKFYRQKDGPRKNELTNGVRISLNKIANRIDKGYNLEVRVEPIAQKEEDAKKDQHIQEAIAAIRSAIPKMQFMKLEGHPLLKLPEKEEEVKDKLKKKE